MIGKRTYVILLAFFVISIGRFSGLGEMHLAYGETASSAASAPQTASAGYLEKIVLENPAQGKERITVGLSKLTGATVQRAGEKSLLLKLENTFVPQDFKEPLGEGLLLRNVSRIVPSQEILDGRHWAYVKIDLNQAVPHSVRQDGNNILIDFNVSGLAYGQEKAPQEALAAPAPAAEGAGQTVDKAGNAEAVTPKIFTGHKISLDFQDANIKSVFRLLAELANINIVSGDDVKGNITIQMKNVPWDQALDTILSITGLGKKQTGNVITVMNLEKIKKDEADRLAVMEARRKAEAEQAKPEAEPLITRVISIDYTDAKKLTENISDLLKDKEGKPTGSVKVDEHSNALIVQASRADMTRLFPIIEKIDKPTPQVMIKANIVETTKDTARNLGIQWGGMYGQKIGDQGLYITPGGVGGVATAPGSALAGTYTATSGVKGIGGQGFGVNFPATMSGTASGSLGLMFGTIGENILEVQLNALQKDGKLNILSSPSITTLDNQKAFTENGIKVPFVTTESSGGTLTKAVKFENVVLRLEITPHVIDGKNLKMQIMVQKDEVDLTNTVDGNPFIFKKQTETNLIVQDGDTIVISGLTKQKTSESNSGIPGLKDVPVLGWLFKGEGKSESMEEVLIFITPNIMKPQAVAGIQTGPL